MSDGAAGAVALLIAGCHVGLYLISWIWAARSRHIFFLVLIVPTAIAWCVGGFPLVKVITYGTAPFGRPRPGLQTAGFMASVLGFGGFFLCALGELVTILIRATPSRRARNYGKRRKGVAR